MSDDTASTSNLTKAPNWFVAVAGLALIWNLLGVMAFFAQAMMTPEQFSALPLDQQELLKNVPAWANAAFAVAVFGGTLGSVLLLLKKTLAIPMFVLSVCGVSTQMFYSFAMSNSIEVYGAEAAGMPIMIFSVAVALIFMARKAKSEGWSS